MTWLCLCVGGIEMKFSPILASYSYPICLNVHFSKSWMLNDLEDPQILGTCRSLVNLGLGNT